MKNSEFQRFIGDFGHSFPDVGSWLAKSGPEAVSAWRGVIGPLELDDAKAAVQSILAGDVPFPEPWSSFPAAIRRIASKLAASRAERAAVPEQPRPSNGRYSVMAMLEDLRGFLKAGNSQSAAIAMLAKKYPLADDDMPRYACLLCRDRGLVDVWSHRSVQSVLWGEKPFRHYTAVALCECDSGRGRHTDANGIFNPPHGMAIYDAGKMCVVRSRDASELRAWIDERRHARQLELCV
jgi:hypothetical protein